MPIVGGIFHSELVGWLHNWRTVRKVVKKILQGLTLWSDRFKRFFCQLPLKTVEKRRLTQKSVHKVKKIHAFVEENTGFTKKDVR